MLLADFHDSNIVEHSEVPQVINTLAEREKGPEFREIFSNLRRISELSTVTINPKTYTQEKKRKSNSVRRGTQGKQARKNEGEGERDHHVFNFLSVPRVKQISKLGLLFQIKRIDSLNLCR